MTAAAPVVRRTSQNKATMARLRRSETRVAAAQRDDEPAEGFLRRRRVKPITRKIYEKALTDFRVVLGRLVVEYIPLSVLDLRLDAEMVRLYMQGELPGKGRILFYAICWLRTIMPAQLPLSNASRIGHAKVDRQKLEQPLCWEEVVLMALWLLTTTQTLASPMLAAVAAVAFLLGFDRYARGGDMLLALRSELFPPVANQTGSAAKWSLTLFPSWLAQSSKTGLQDHTVAVGSTHASREWLNKLASTLSKWNMQEKQLFPLSPTLYRDLFNASREALHMDKAHPHQLRHGGASQDGMTTDVKDMTLQERGGWRSSKSIMRYRKEAAYLRRLQTLTPVQIRRAQTSYALVCQLVETRLPASRKRNRD